MRRLSITFLSLLLLAAACEASSSGNGDPETDVTSHAGDDTAAVQGQEHPHWPTVEWDSFWPAAGESAVYSVTTVSQEAKDLTASVERDVEFQGSTWTRIVVGELEAGKDGAAIYIDDSEPWEVRVKGVETFDAAYADGPAISEYFDEPMVLPLASETGSPTQVDATLNSTLYGTAQTFDVTYEISVESYDAQITVPYGALTGCVHVQVHLTGDLGDFMVDVYAHPEQRIVSWTDAPGFLLVELKEAWQ